VLERSGISFDPAERPVEAPLAEQGTGLQLALGISLLLALATAAWIAAFSGYYLLPPDRRPNSPWHELLRPSGPVGLGFGIAACALILVNLAYLLRRSRLGERLPGSLKAWMTSHVVTGILATLLVVLHGAMAPRNTIGGQAFAALAVLLVTGAIGRWFYSFVPRAANGRELQVDEVRARLAALSSEWDRDGRGLADAVRAEIDALAGAAPWRGHFLRRAWALAAGESQLRAAVARVRSEARARDVPPDQIARLVALTREAHRAALMAAHYEDLRGLLSSWRFVHRWMALLMVLLAAWHVVTAVRFGGVLG
jgi:dihydropyrimidine dehydrogenase (NAD+) subunit PreT